MPRISITLTDEITKELQRIADEAEKPLSGIASEMIEVGLRFYKVQNKPEDLMDQKRKDLAAKTPENILRILAITSEILSCVYDKNAVKYKQETAAEELVVIKQKIQAYVEDYVSVGSDERLKNHPKVDNL